MVNDTLHHNPITTVTKCSLLDSMP